MLANHVSLVAHADWSKSEHKRWLAIAKPAQGEGWIAHATRQVVNARELLLELKTAAGPGGCTLVGFDFPIGMPAAYVHQAGIDDFLEWLPLSGQGRWSEFYEVAECADQINLYRPFYPMRPGGTRRSHLVQKLGVGSFNDLRRRCEHAHRYRRAACPLFWTLGGQQVGKAAISGWQEVLVPGLLDKGLNLAIWPFSGRLGDLLRAETVVIAETYPAEAYHPLGIRFNSSNREIKSGKRRQTARRANAGNLLDFARQAGVECTPELKNDILAGFGNQAGGEDRFDAWVGLLWMLHWLRRNDFPEPEDQVLLRLEGWIFGQRPNTNS